jgi:type IV pilus assembly protein PilY1
MIVGSGPDFTNGTSAYHIVDVSDGTLLYSEPVSTHADPNMTTSATVVDLDFDQLGDVFYMGDLIGNMWRVDIRTFPPSRTLLFAGDQPIQSRPILTIDYNDDVYVYFGTGKYLEPDDFDTATGQTMYCVIDDHSQMTATRSDMVDQTGGINPLVNSSRGWYIDLEQGPGERITEQAALVAGVVYATSFEPTTELCGFGGHSWLYKMNFRNGGAADGDDDQDNDTTDGRFDDLGDGIASRPVVDVVNEKIIVQGSDTEIHVYDTVGVVRLLVIRSWRQRYN